MHPKTLEALEPRLQFAVTASFLAGSGVLSVLGDVADNKIIISRNAAGAILVNNGAVAVAGGTATVANTALIQIFGQGGDDALELSEVNGALPAANIFGGAGSDLIIGGSGADQLFGQAGNDDLQGKGGNDFLFGGADNDVLTGGDADDQAFGESGDDRMIWNPGDDTDLNEGADGTDTVEVNGGNGAETFTTTPNGTRVRFDRTTPAPFSIDIGTSENLVVNMNGGDDIFTGSNGLATLINLTVDGGTGNDSITGGDGADALRGGDGNDLVVGGRGNDVALMGAGDDTFVWNPGDGSDVVEGQDGADTMQFNGANIAEQIDMSANGGRLRLTRDVASITTDTDDVETVNFKALGGVDKVTVNNLTGTDVTQVNVDLGSGTGSGDGAADTVIVFGTNAADNVQVAGAGTSYAVVGLPAAVNVTNSESANDQLNVTTVGGNDTISAATLPSTVTKLSIDAGAGNDVILGSQGVDTTIGGDGNDFIDGNQGNDVAFMGAGDDTFQWDPGDGSDVVEGQDGTDTMAFNGANIAEQIDISANGPRVRFTRDVANITMDLDDVETTNFRALGGADQITVGDLSGTDMTRVDLDLRGPNGAGDGAADTIIVNGTQGADVFGAAGDAGGINVFGLHTAVNILSPEQANDRLTLNGQAGDDVINASSLEVDGIQLTENGGLGADLLIGSKGNDLVNGGDGNDTALMGAGDDVFVWNPGDDNDILEGQAGHDRMLFNGANIAENIDIAANGGRVRFFRNVASVTMDLNDVEGIDFNALGGVDNVVVNDLSGTDVTEVNVNLAGTPNGTTGDGAADSVAVSGTAGSDVIVVSGSNGSASVLGLSARVNLTGTEPANDSLTINAGAGDDVVDASGLAATSVRLTENGGDGDDVLIGSEGDDTLNGENGDDVLIGGGGQDVLNGGPGNNVVLQSSPGGTILPTWAQSMLDRATQLVASLLS
jgi:Ca2+-binding RTX toxin-like protein